MRTFTQPRPVVKTHQPVRGSARWLTRPDGRGRGQLVIATEAGVDRLYQTAAVLDRGTFLGWALTRLSTGDTYHIDTRTGTGAWACSCPAYVFTAHKRGPCKHVSVLRAALLAVGWAERAAVLAKARAYEEASHGPAA